LDQKRLAVVLVTISCSLCPTPTPLDGGADDSAVSVLTMASNVEEGDSSIKEVAARPEISKNFLYYCAQTPLF